MSAPKLTKLLAAERRIKLADGNTIIERWRWGRDCLTDHRITTEAGHLRHGVGEGIARAAGISDREIRRRVQCARTYRSEAEIGHICGQFRSWRDLTEANFPAAPDGLFEDITGGDPEQLPLDGFPAAFKVGDRIIPFPLATLRVMGDHCASMERMTAGYQRADERRRAEYDRLVRAAGGDLDVSIGEALGVAEAGAA